MFVMQSLAACVNFVWLGTQLDPNLNYKLRYSIQVAKLNFEGVIQNCRSTDSHGSVLLKVYQNRQPNLEKKTDNVVFLHATCQQLQQQL